MGANKPVKQHIIPEFLLRNLADSSGRLWIYDKRQQKIYTTSTKKAFVQRNAYTIYKFEHVAKDTAYDRFIDSLKEDYIHETETFSRNLEGVASPIISHMIDRARSNRFPKLSQEQADVWKRFMLATARRTPESRSRATSIDDDEAFYLAAKARAIEMNFDLPNKEVLFQDPRVSKLMKIVIANVHARFSAGVSRREKNEEERFCRNTGLCVAIIPSPSPTNSFLIGSHGLAIVQTDPHGKSAKGSWLPIAHDVAVLATPAPDKEYLLVLGNSKKDLVQIVNRSLAASSSTIAGKYEELVRSFHTTS